MALSSADIKRQILMSAKESPFREKIENPPGISEGEVMEMGNDLEKLTQTRGWTLIESYMMRRMNLVGLVMNDQTSPDQKGIAKGFIELLQWIQLTIQAKDNILAKEKVKNETQNVSKDQGK